MPLAEFDSPSQALAVIPRTQKFAVFEGTRGRPVDVPNPIDGKNEWDHDQFTDAITKGTIPRTRYFMRPYAQPGKMVASSKRITLNLEMADDSASATVGDPMPDQPML